MTLKKRPEIDIPTLVAAVRSGQRSALARAITLVESYAQKHRQLADQLLDQLIVDSGNSIRIAISGPPGAGKSTFIEHYGQRLINAGHKVAVLAIDPSGSQNGGSILGDKTRMPYLSQHPNAYIRPSPSSGTLGGITARTREAIYVCEAAGFDRIIIETVGIGQSETSVATVADLFLLLLLPGGGDDLQGMKKGVMDVADIIAVNKSDGANIALAKRTASDYQSALRLLSAQEHGLLGSVIAVSALEGTGMDRLEETVEDYVVQSKRHGRFYQKRQEQALSWMNTEYQWLINRWVNNNDSNFQDQKFKFETQIKSGQISSRSAAKQLFDYFLQSKTSDSI